MRDLKGSPESLARVEVEPARLCDGLRRKRRAVDLAEAGEVQRYLAVDDVVKLAPDAPVPGSTAVPPQLGLVDLRRRGQEPRVRPLVVVDQRPDRRWIHSRPPGGQVEAPVLADSGDRNTPDGTAADCQIS
jgi:hypothetical protein